MAVASPTNEERSSTSIDRYALPVWGAVVWELQQLSISCMLGFQSNCRRGPEGCAVVLVELLLLVVGTVRRFGRAASDGQDDVPVLIGCALLGAAQAAPHVVSAREEGRGAPPARAAVGSSLAHAFSACSRALLVLHRVRGARPARPAHGSVTVAPVAQGKPPNAQLLAARDQDDGRVEGAESRQ